MSWRSRPTWLAPATALTAAHVAAMATLWLASGGREISDDAPHLLRLVREPLLLLRAPNESGLSATWASFPPLLPPLFGALVRPWLAIASDFVALRLGSLAWTLVALAALDRLARGRPRDEIRAALWLYAAVPLPLLASAVLPQEESYVSLFGMAIVGTALRGSALGVAALLAAAALAGKVFLLLLAIPVAFSGATPIRSLAAFGLAGGGALAGYLGFHLMAHEEAPLLGYRLDPIQGVSIWSLLRLLGVASAGWLPLASTALAGVASLGFCAAGRRRGLGVLPLAAGTLWIAQSLVAVAMPPYLLWNLPFLALLLAGAPRRRPWVGAIFAWSLAAYGAKLCRATALALSTPRGEGKGAVARIAASFLGTDFPYHAAQTLLTGLCLAIAGAFLIALLARTGPGSRRNGSSEVESTLRGRDAQLSERESGAR